MKKDLQQQLDKERKGNAEKVKDLLADFKQDMKIVEGAHERKTSEQTQKALKLETKVQKQGKAIEELKNLL